MAASRKTSTNSSALDGKWRYSAPARTPSPTPSRPPTASPTPTFQNGVSYTVVSGDTVSGIAQRFGVTVEAIATANRLNDPTAISIGQVLVIPDPKLTPAPSAAPATLPPPYPRLRGFQMPIAGACLPSNDYLMPNAPREYRYGVHEGVDFYTAYNCVDVPANAPVLAAKAGVVIRADTEYQPLTPEELDQLLARTKAEGYTDAAALERFRGRQVWVDHGDGVVTRYCHLSGVAGDIKEGMTVEAGHVLGYVGDSGTPESVTSPGLEIHLITGTAGPGRHGTLVSTVNGEPCVWHRHTVKHHQVRYRTDAQGKTHGGGLLLMEVEVPDDFAG